MESPQDLIGKLPFELIDCTSVDRLSNHKFVALARPEQKPAVSVLVAHDIRGEEAIK